MTENPDLKDILKQFDDIDQAIEFLKEDWKTVIKDANRKIKHEKLSKDIGLQ